MRLRDARRRETGVDFPPPLCHFLARFSIALSVFDFGIPNIYTILQPCASIMSAGVGYTLLIVAIAIGIACAPETTAWVTGIGFWTFVGFGVWHDWKEKRNRERLK